VNDRRVAIGVDVGGSGIKVGAVDTGTGQLLAERLRVVTPNPSTPAAVIRAIARLVKRVGADLDATTPVGVGVPCVVIDGVTKSAANIDQGWIGFDAEAALAKALKRPVHVLNDADAAGLAEMRYGAGAGKDGIVLVLTLGTGVGSALFNDGRLVPNTELGHMEVGGHDAERRSAAAARTRRGLSWKDWAADLDQHLDAIDKILWPSLLILGGGVSKRADKFIPRLTVRPPVVPATLQNDAGIVGAALAASEREAKAARAGR
jgi:polyphosphate glucokinase